MNEKKNRFEIGQKVYDKREGTWGIVTGFPGMKEYDRMNYSSADKGMTLNLEGKKTGKTWSFIKECEPFIEPIFKSGFQFKINKEGEFGIGERVQVVDTNICDKGNVGRIGNIEQISGSTFKYLVFGIWSDVKGIENGIVEVIRPILNKKKRCYYYVCYDIDNGNAYLFSEKEIADKLPKFSTEDKECFAKDGCSAPCVEMTMAQVCKALGKTVKIVK